jgi:hypothetical protein
MFPSLIHIVPKIVKVLQIDKNPNSLHHFPMNNSPDQLLPQIEVLRTALSKKHRWYTGLPIKSYLKKTLLRHIDQTEPKNLPLDSGRWSAYCHYSLEAAFLNLLEKHSISPQSTVVVHPFTPTHLIETLQTIGCTIQFLDIDTNTLTFDEKLFDEHLEKTSHIDLVIHHVKYGSTQTVENLLGKTTLKTIPSLVFYDQDFITTNLLSLIKAHTLGSFLWLGGDSFWDEMLGGVIPTKLPTQKWFFAWYLETRTLSILEYHLTESQDDAVPVIECYYQILNEAYKSSNFWAGLYYSAINQFLYQLPKRKPEELTKTIETGYQNMLKGAIPDVVFELKLLEKVDQKTTTKDDINDFSHLLSNSFLRLLKSMYDTDQSQPFPHFSNQENYAGCWLLLDSSTKWDSWATQKSIKIQSFPELSEIVKNQNLPETKKLTEQGKVIDILENFQTIKYL